MAEALVSTILQKITTIIVQEALDEGRLLKDVKEDMKKLTLNLTAIKSLLEDAEQKKIIDEPVRLWLDRLKEESFDMEDALDEWRTVLLYQPTENASFLQRKVRFFLGCFSFPSRVAKYHSIAHNIKEINGRLDDIAKEKDRYHLTSNKIRTLLREESQCLIDKSNVVGRDDVKKQIIHHLLCGTSKEEEGSPVQTISVVGMGGIGKTTLAQLVYHDKEVKQNFPSRIWACVSDIFDVRRVAIAILLGLEGLDKLPFLQVESIPVTVLLEKICKSIEGKKYLLILDDVWTDKQELGGLNFAFKHGAPGSRILVTTRKEDVAGAMGSSRTIHLEKLSQEEIWSILRRKALGGKEQKTCEDLEAIGLRIAEKCKGIPLVAKTLAGFLQFKTNKQEWQDVLNSKLWEMDIVHKEVFIPLLLSYYDLPSPIRQCFTYCAVFAKDHPFLVCHLIAHWRAQGYLGSDGGDGSSMELEGFKYFKCLAARSFFQDFHFGYHVTCKMHDLVHDFAIFLVKGEFVTAEISKGYKSLKMEKLVKTCRHLTVMLEKGLPFPESISDAEKLRSLVGYGDDAVISEKVLCNLFNQARRLRLLEMNMRGYCGSTIPEEIGNLLHLRYLNLNHGGNLKSLPKALCRLRNLQFLDLYGCTNLERLPDEIANLVNLKLLRAVGCLGLTCFPKGVSRLTRLTQLLGLIVRVDRDDPEEFSMGDLANLKELVVLFMKMMGNAFNVYESKRVQLQNLQEVKILVAGAIKEPEDVILESLNLSSVPRRNFETNDFFNKHCGTSRNELQYYGF